MKTIEKLFIKNGKKVRTKPMPPRLAFGKKEQSKLLQVIRYYSKKKLDPQYKGKFEQEFQKKFNKYMGGGSTLLLSSGTAAAFVAIESLNLKKGSEVIVSPFFEAGPMSALIKLGFQPIVADSSSVSLNTNLEEIKKKISKKTSAIFLVHSAGEPAEVNKIYNYAKRKKIKLIEDVSQSPGGSVNGKKLGAFGDVCCISAMFTKTLTTCGSGGIIYTKNLKTYKNILAHSDRGKPVWKKNSDRRDPSQNLFPALNWNINEFSSSIATESLKRLDITNKKRLWAIKLIMNLLRKKSKVCRGYNFKQNSSPYFFPIWVDTNKISCSKIKFANAIKAEGIELNPHYKFLCSDWKWTKKYLKNKINTPNAKKVRDTSFNLFVNENFKIREINDVISAILKVEKFYYKNERNKKR
tara:strand:+ start:809 stop:2038 length:1230 start_codon:yes stop_codon:yes gene_type:complete